MGACLFDINKCELLTKSACKEKDGLWDSTCTCADDFPSISVCIQDTGTMGDKKVIVVVKINDPQERMSHEWYADGESQSVGGSLTGGGPDYPFKFDLPGEPSGFTTGQEYGLSVLNKEREVIGFDKKTLRLSLPFKIEFTEETEEGVFDRANWKGRQIDVVVLPHDAKVAITPHNVAGMSIDVPDYSWAYSRSDSWKASSDGDDLPALILKQEGKAGGKKYKLEIGESDTNTFFTIRVNEKESYTLLSKQQDEKDISGAEDEAKRKREEGQGVDQGGTWNKDGTVCIFNPPPSDEEYREGDPTGSAKAPRSPDSPWETVGDSDDKWKIEHNEVRWELSRVTLDSDQGGYQWKLEPKPIDNDKDLSRYPDEYIMLIDEHGRRTYELKVPPILPFKIEFTEETEEGVFDRANWKGRQIDVVVLPHDAKVAITPHNVAGMSIDVPDYSWAYSRSDSWKASSDGDDLPALILKQEGKAGGKKYKLEIGESDTNTFFTIRVNEKESYTLLSKQQDEKDISGAEDEAKRKREEGQGVDQGGTWNKDGTVCIFNPPPSDEEYREGDPTGSAKAPRSPDSPWETVGDSDDKWKIEHDDVRWELSCEGAREGEYKWKLELMDKNPNHYPDEPIMLIDQHGRRTYELKVPPNNKSTEAEETPSSSGNL